MKKQSWLARAFLLLVSLLSSIDAVSASWLITGDHTDNTDTSASITTDDTKAVCYIKNRIDDVDIVTYYTSLDKALTVAEGNSIADTICVIPNLKKDDGTISPVEIKNSHTIETGDSLVLPYAYENADKSVTYIACGMNVETWKTDGITNDMIHGNNSVTFADQDDKSIETYRQTRVVLGTGKYTVNLTVNGNLLIGGKLSNPTTGVSGQTAGSYCEMVLSEYAHIICSGSGAKIECDGYIKKSDASNQYNYLRVDSDTNGDNGGTLKTPLVIYDFKGGSYTYAAATAKYKVSPFYVFDFPNVQTSVQVNCGSYWETKICVYADNSYLPADGLFFVAPSNDKSINPILVQESSDSVIYVDYVPSSHGYTSSAVDGTKTTIAIKGEVDIGSISFEYSMNKTTSSGTSSKISVLVDSSSFYLPISYRFDFALKKDSVLNSSKKIKFMNGSSVKIENGATLNVTGPLAIYGSDFKDDASHYPAVAKDGTAIGGATFINNGTINVTDGGVIGGIIATSADDDSAVLNYATTTFTINSPETESISGEGTKAEIANKSYSCTATGRIFTLKSDNTIDTETANCEIENNYYRSAQNATEKTKGWCAYLLSISASTDISGDLKDDDYGLIKATAKFNSDILKDPVFTWNLVHNVNAYVSYDFVNGENAILIKNKNVSEITLMVSLTAKTSTETYAVSKKITIQGRTNSEETIEIDAVGVTAYQGDGSGGYKVTSEEYKKGNGSKTINNPTEGEYTWKLEANLWSSSTAIPTANCDITYIWSLDGNVTSKGYLVGRMNVAGEVHQEENEEVKTKTYAIETTLTEKGIEVGATYKVKLQIQYTLDGQTKTLPLNYSQKPGYVTFQFKKKS